MDPDEERANGAQKDAPPRDDDSVLATIERLLAAGRDLAEAEFAWAKLKGLSLAVVLRRGVILAIISVVFLIVGLALSLVAGVIALEPVVGLLGATLIVAIVALSGALLFRFLALRTLGKLADGDTP